MYEKNDGGKDASPTAIAVLENRNNFNSKGKSKLLRERYDWSYSSASSVKAAVRENCIDEEQRGVYGVWNGAAVCTTTNGRMSHIHEEHARREEMEEEESYSLENAQLYRALFLLIAGHMTMPQWGNSMKSPPMIQLKSTKRQPRIQRRSLTLGCKPCSLVGKRCGFWLTGN